MKTYQMTRLIAVAAIATLSVACGASSPMGPDVAANATVSALRIEPLPPQAPEAPLPPSAPEAPSPEQVPVPMPSPKPDPTSIDLPGSVPAPADRGGNLQTPQPDPVPNDPITDGPASSDPTPQPSPGPNTNPGTGGGSVPTLPPSGDPGVPQSPAGTCLAASIDIMPLAIFTGTSGMTLEATLLGKDGLEITDSSCEKVLWEAEGSSAGSSVVITYGATSRFVTISGMAGTYTIGATTPNGASASLVIVLP